MNLKGKSFLKLLDFTPEEIAGLLALSAELKAKKKGTGCDCDAHGIDGRAFG